MKNILKFSLTLLLIFSVLFINFQSISYADYNSEMENLISREYNDSTNTEGKVTNIVATVITTTKIAAVCVAIVMILVLAMKYMTAAPGEKADIKKSAIQYTVGAVVLFSVIGILEIINKFASVIQS